MLETLINCTHAVPTLMLMYPIEPKGFFAKAKSIVQKEMCILFVCSVTRKPVKCGPDGNGYRITVTREWVKAAAPLLAIALKITQIAMTAYGLPFPFSSLPFDFSFDAYVGNFMTLVEVLLIGSYHCYNYTYYDLRIDFSFSISFISPLVIFIMQGRCSTGSTVSFKEW